MQKELDPLTVFYDGACPMCRKEIAWYKRQQGASLIVWEDISQTSGDMVRNDLCKTDALLRLHVRTAEGNLLSGALAFSEIWKNLPNFKLLGKVVGLPLISTLAESLYKIFLKVRPALQRRLKA